MPFTVDGKDKLAAQMHQALLAERFSTAQLTAVIDKCDLLLEGDFSAALQGRIAKVDVVAKNLAIIADPAKDINTQGKAQAFRQAALRALACHQIDSGKLDLLDIAKQNPAEKVGRRGIREVINKSTEFKDQVTVTDNNTQLNEEDCTAIQQAAILKLAKQGIDGLDDGTKSETLLKVAMADVGDFEGLKGSAGLKDVLKLASQQPINRNLGIEVHITPACLRDIQKHAAMTLVLRSIGGDTANSKKMVAVAALVRQDPAKDDAAGLKAYLKNEDGRALCGLGADDDAGAGVSAAVIDALTPDQLQAIQAKAVAQLANCEIKTETNDIPVQALVDASSDDDAKARAGIVALVGGSPKAVSTKLSGPDVERLQKNARRRLKVLLSKTFNDKVAEVCKLIAKSAVHAPDLQARAQCALMFKGFPGEGFQEPKPKWGSKTPVDSSLGEASDTNTNANNDDVSIVSWKTEQGMFKVSCDANGNPKRVSFPAKFSQKTSYNKADKDLIKGLVTALKPEKEGDQQPPLHFSGTNATPAFMSALKDECNEQGVGLTIPDGLTISGEKKKGSAPSWEVTPPEKGADDFKFVKQEPEPKPSPKHAVKPG